MITNRHPGYFDADAPEPVDPVALMDRLIDWSTNAALSADLRADLDAAVLVILDLRSEAKNAAGVPQLPTADAAVVVGTVERTDRTPAANP